jgi:hypothetical protein
MNDIQMKDAKNMDGMIVLSSRCTMHRMASSRDYSSSCSRSSSSRSSSSDSSSSSSSSGGTSSSIKRLHP